nr:Tetratricopeptide-like helical [Ipomoea batatas]
MAAIISLEALAMAGADYEECSRSMEELEGDEVPPHLLADDDDEEGRETPLISKTTYPFLSLFISSSLREMFSHTKRLLIRFYLMIFQKFWL